MRRKQLENYERKLRQQRAAFWNRAFLAALPECITVNGWTKGEKPINDVSSRTALAATFADEALKHFRIER
jgi:hypothetical protein